MRILVTDGDERSALAATRCLGQVHEVFVAASSVRSLASTSRFARVGIATPDALRFPDECGRAVAAAVREHGIDVVLPISDASCRVLLGVRAALSPARVAGPTLDAFERVSDKAATTERARELGLGVPAGRVARALDEAREIAKEIAFPVVLKPVRSVAGANHRLAVVRVDDADALRRAWPEAVRAGAVLVQQVVPGRGEGVFLLRWQGRTHALLAHRRLREKPPEGGTSVLRETIVPDPNVVAALERMLDEAAFDGVAMAEFRSDGAQRWLMEVNARLWGSLQLAVDAGVDFPRLLVDCAVGQLPIASPSARLGVRSRWELGDVDHAIALARGARDSEGRTGFGAALRVLCSRTGPGTRFEVFRRDDPRPFVREVRDWMRALRRS